MRSESCDIFCNVIDNYGDIGVCWRLAKLLANEHGLTVRLWVDDLGSFAKLCPEADTTLESQQLRGVEVRLWRKDFPGAQPADLVIEAFACKLPESYVAAMASIANRSAPQAKMDARRQGIVERDSTVQYSERDDVTANTADASSVGREPVWINLEYLSAEDWVETYHKLPSPHPSLPLTKYFFFPGFTAKTGGLLLERDLLALRDAFDPEAWWRALGVPQRQPGEVRVSLFGYENPALAELFDAWANDAQPVLCLVPEGRILPQVEQYFCKTSFDRLITSDLADVFGQPSRMASSSIRTNGSVWQRGSLRVQILPFVEQERYDELLWACDINFVRGEDSFVRAQWAARPFVWQIYPQHDGVHMQKLRDFMAKYCEGLPPDASQALHRLWEAWNGEPGNLPAAWNDFMAHQSMLRLHSGQWARKQAENNLALNLLDFFRETGRMRAFKIEGQ